MARKLLLMVSKNGTTYKIWFNLIFIFFGVESNLYQKSSEWKTIITSDNGEEYYGKTLDISNADVGYRSNGLLRFHEVV